MLAEAVRNARRERGAHAVMGAFANGAASRRLEEEACRFSERGGMRAMIGRAGTPGVDEGIVGYAAIISSRRNFLALGTRSGQGRDRVRPAESLPAKAIAASVGDGLPPVALESRAARPSDGVRRVGEPMPPAEGRSPAVLRQIATAGGRIQQTVRDSLQSERDLARQRDEVNLPPEPRPLSPLAARGGPDGAAGSGRTSDHFVLSPPPASGGASNRDPALSGAPRGERGAANQLVDESPNSPAASSAGHSSPSQQMDSGNSQVSLDFERAFDAALLQHLVPAIEDSIRRAAARINNASSIG